MKRLGKRKKQKKKVGRFVFLSLLFFAACAAFFREPLITSGVNLALRLLLPVESWDGIQHQKIEWKNGRLTIAGLELKGEEFQAHVDRVDVTFSFASFHLRPEVLCLHPEVTIQKSKEDSGKGLAPLAALIPSSRFSLKLDVQNGVLNLHDGQQLARLFFNFQSGQTKEKIGALSLSYDPSPLIPPALFVDLRMEQERLQADLHVQQLDVARCLQLTTFFVPSLPTGWREVRGELELSSRVLFDSSLVFSQMGGTIDLQGFSAHNPTQGIDTQADSLHAEFTYPFYSDEEGPIWKRLMASLSLQGGEFVCSKWGMRNVHADLNLDPNTDPAFNLGGTLVCEEKTSPLQIEGKGSMHEDSTFWLEMSLKAAKDREAFVTVCSTEEENYVVQADIKKLSEGELAIAHALASFYEPAMKKWSLKRGDLSGKCAAWIERGEMVKFDWDTLIFRNLQLVSEGEALSLKVQQLESAGQFNHHVLAECTTHISGGVAKMGAWQADNMEATLHIDDEKFVSSTLTGKVKGIETECHLSGDISAPDIDLALTATARELLAPFFPTAQWPDSGVGVTASLKAEDGGYTLLGRADFVEGHQVSFGSSFKIDPAIQLDEGWIRSEKLPPFLFQPFVAQAAPGSTLDGEWDLFGNFNGKEVVLSLQGNRVAFDHPTFFLTVDSIGVKDPLLLKTDGRLALTYQIQEASLKGELALKGAQIKEKKNGTVIEGFGADIAFDTAADTWNLLSPRGIVTLGAQQLFVGGRGVELGGGKGFFDLHLRSQKEEIARLAGRIEKSQTKEIRCLFERGKTHLFKIDLSGSRLAFAPDGALAAAEAYFQLHLHELPKHIQTLSGLGVIQGIPAPEEWSGTVHAKVSMLDAAGRFGFHVEGKELTLGDTRVATFGLKGTKSGTAWAIDQFNWDKMGGSLLLTYQNSLLQLTKSDLTMPSGMRVKSSKPIQCQFSPGSCAIKAFEFIVEEGKVAHELKGSATLTSGKEGFLVEGKLADGNYQIAGRPWNMKQIQFNATAEKLLMSCKTSFQEQPLGVHLQLEFGETLLGMVKLQDKMKILFKGNQIENIQGTLWGFDVQLAREKGIVPTYRGSVKFDIAQANSLFSKAVQKAVKELQIGSGYELAGTFTIPKEGIENLHFVGELKGNNFTIMGYQFVAMRAGAEIGPDRIALDDLRVSDDAATIGIKQIRLNKTAGDVWAFDIPLITMQDFHPTTLQRRLNPDKAIKPFRIKNLTLHDLKGRIGDTSTFRGRGNLYFTNAFKKESSFFDLSLDLIKDLGLDLGLLTPIYGEVALLLKGDKFYLTDLKNTYSEGSRSQFFLAGDTSYLDLSGNIHIDLTLKQDVVLKIAEPFVLNVRGTLEKPRYGLQR
jgi:hypothetical protein